MEDNKSTIKASESDILKFAKIIQRNENDDESFSSQVDEYLNGNIPIFQTLSLGQTPNILHLVGAKAEILTIKQSVLHNSMMKENQSLSKHTEGHDISIGVLKQMPKALRSPIMIFRGQHPQTVVVLTELKNRNDKNIIVPISLDLRSTDSTVNKITSIYGKDNIVGYLDKHFEQIIAINKEKANELFTTIGYQLSKTTSAICFDNSIAYSKQNVKYPKEKKILKSSKKEDGTQAKEFQEKRTPLQKRIDKAKTQYVKNAVTKHEKNLKPPNQER